MDRGANVRYHDPYNAQIRIDGDRRKRRTPLTPANLRASDLVVIVTDHSSYDYEMIARHAPLVLDTRNATAGVRIGRSKIHKL
jgi:UDP-N-acetyl-D-glucosamine dehydrogenase